MGAQGVCHQALQELSPLALCNDFAACDIFAGAPAGNRECPCHQASAILCLAYCISATCLSWQVVLAVRESWDDDDDDPNGLQFLVEMNFSNRIQDADAVHPRLNGGVSAPDGGVSPNTSVAQVTSQNTGKSSLLEAKHCAAGVVNSVVLQSITYLNGSRIDRPKVCTSDAYEDRVGCRETASG